MPNGPDLMTAADVAELVSVHVETVRRWAREGLILAVVLPSGRRRYRRTDVERLLAPVEAAS